MLQLGVAFLAMTVSTAAWGTSTLELSPIAPKAKQRVHFAYYNSDICASMVDRSRTIVEMSSNLIHVRFHMAAQETGCNEFGSLLVEELGALPAGDYSIQAEFASIAPYLGGVTVADTRVSADFTVSPRDSDENSPIRDNTGIWWSTTEPGWSMLLYQRSDDHLIGGWLTYDAQGHPVWFFSVPGRWTTAGTVYEADLMVTSNGPYFGGSPTSIVPLVRRVGSIVYNLGGYGSPIDGAIERGGRITYTVDNVSNTRLMSNRIE